MTGALHSLGHFLLILQGGAGQTARQDLALLVHEFLQEFGVFIVDVLDTAFFETAIFFLFDVNRYGSDVFNIVLLCHNLKLLQG